MLGRKTLFTGEKAVRIINKKCKNIFSNKTGSIIEF